MKILVTICARAGSKGVKSKNVRFFCGNPLVFYTLETYKSFCENIKEVTTDIQLALNTDSEELIKQVEDSGVEYILIKRQEKLAGDLVAKFDVIQDTMFQMESMNQKKYDVVVDLDLTSPMRTWKDIKGTLFTLLGDENADIAYSVTEGRRSPYFNMVCEKENGYYGKILKGEYVARQQTPLCYDMNASVYAYRRNYLLNNGEKYDDRKDLIWKMKDTAVLDIDSEEDFKLMEVIFQFLITNDNEFREQFKMFI